MARPGKFELTRKRKAEYLHDPEFCPFCGSEEIEAERFEQSGSEVWRTVRCNACGGEFDEVFTLTNIEYHE